MNYTEDLAITYLRLNGFFVLPQFTVFEGDSYNHVDILALHPANGGLEVAGARPLPRDEELFKGLSALIKRDAKSSWVGVIGEVKSDSTIDIPLAEHVDYAKPFLGNVDAIALLSFRNAGRSFEIKDGALLISNEHAHEWFNERVATMDKVAKKLTKSGSWWWSEPRLQIFLQARKAYGLKENKPRTPTNRET